MEPAPDAPEEARVRQVRLIFSTITNRYDFFNHFLSAGRDIHWRRFLVLLFKPAPPPTGPLVHSKPGRLPESGRIDYAFPLSGRFCPGDPRGLFQEVRTFPLTGGITYLYEGRTGFFYSSHFKRGDRTQPFQESPVVDRPDLKTVDHRSPFQAFLHGRFQANNNPCFFPRKQICLSVWPLLFYHRRQK